MFIIQTRSVKKTIFKLILNLVHANCRCREYGDEDSVNEKYFFYRSGDDAGARGH